MEEQNDILEDYIIDKLDTIRWLRMRCGDSDRVLLNGKLEAYLDILEYIYTIGGNK